MCPVKKKTDGETQSSLISQPCQSEPGQNKNSSEAFKIYIKLFGKAFDKL